LIRLTDSTDPCAPAFLLTPDSAVHDEWFRAKVQQALDHSRHGVAHSKKVEAHFAKRRAAALRKAR
jgi:hypothetical protein